MNTFSRPKLLLPVVKQAPMMYMKNPNIPLRSLKRDEIPWFGGL
jgi:hypothetical protein